MACEKLLGSRVEVDERTILKVFSFRELVRTLATIGCCEFSEGRNMEVLLRALEDTKKFGDGGALEMGVSFRGESNWANGWAIEVL